MKRTHIRKSLVGLTAAFAIASCSGWLDRPIPVQAYITQAEYNRTKSQIDSNISSLQDKIKDYRAKAESLSKEADSLQKQIDELQNQQNILQAQIDLNAAKQQKLGEEIAANEAKIKSQTEVLSKNLQEQYYSSQTTPLDILMNSDSVSDYVDRQTRQQSVSNQISSTVREVKQLKAELEKQKADVDGLVNQQNIQKQSLADNQAQQQTLLSQKQDQKQAADDNAAAAQKEIEKNQAQLAAAFKNIYPATTGGSSSGGSSGGYAGQVQVGKMLTRNYSGTSACGNSYGGGRYPYCGGMYATDAYQLYQAQCVSYAAWRINVGYGKYVGGFHGDGNAYRWPVSAVKYSGAQIVTNPQPGDAAIMPANNISSVGHAMVVEKVLSDGWVLVSQYNWGSPGRRYSTMEIKGGVTYLRFF